MSGRQKSVLVYVEAEGMGGPALMVTPHILCISARL